MPGGDAGRRPLQLLLVIHNHQPVGNLDHVFRDAYNTAYAPFADLLERHPGVRCAVHYTGPLLEWLYANEPSLLERVAELQSRGQVEWLTGGLYEPILAAIPDDDKVDQIRALTKAVAQITGQAPRGAWMAERVWEPHLPRFLARAGVEYTLLDEEHFAKTGVAPELLHSPYFTDELGESVTVFPISTQLRYLIPWRGVDEVMAHLLTLYEQGAPLTVFGDDGEKLGSWPGTYQLCYEDGWLDDFLTQLATASDWVTTVLPDDIARGDGPLPYVSLPSASYPEMEQWSLPPVMQQALAALREETPEAAWTMRLGHWRGFLDRYSESRWLQQRVSQASARVRRLPPGPNRDRALDHVWRAQCNCPYWHGVFGGIYLYHIRHANHSHLIQAETIADAALPCGRGWEMVDVDVDGVPDLILRGAQAVLAITGADGALAEWDLRGPALNLGNTLADYHEAYADDTAPLPAEPRRALRVHLVHGDPPTADEDAAQWPSERLSWWPPYLQADARDGAVSAMVQRSAAVDGPHLCTRYLLPVSGDHLEVLLDLERAPLGDGPLTIAAELCIAMPPGAHTLGTAVSGDEVLALSAAGGWSGTMNLKLEAMELTLRLQWGQAAEVCCHPIWSEHRTEHGAEQVYQGTRVLICWRLAPGQDRSWSEGITASWASRP